MHTTLSASNATTQTIIDRHYPTQQVPGFEALLNSFSHSIWVVDAQCQVHFANTAAKHTVKSARCLQMQGNQLKAAHKADQQAFFNSIQKATQLPGSNPSGTVRSVLRLHVVDTKPPTDLLVLITPFNDFSTGHLFNKCYVKYSNLDNYYAGFTTIQLQKSNLIDPAMLCLFARSYKLTNTEELVLSLLCDGLDAPETATALNVAVSTIRTHVRSLCGKMQTNSIRQLIVKVALLPGAAGMTGIV